MEHTKEQTNLIGKRKVVLWAGVITLLISLLVIYPVERSKANYIDEFGFTYLTLFIALPLIMFGLMGKSFFKGILMVALSAVVGAVFFYFAFPPFLFSSFIAVLLGVPSGIITALLFLIVNHYFFKDIRSYKRIKQVAVYFIILLVVAVLFGYGGDWIFDITEYFKHHF